MAASTSAGIVVDSGERATSALDSHGSAARNCNSQSLQLCLETLFCSCTASSSSFVAVTRSVCRAQNAWLGGICDLSPVAAVLFLSPKVYTLVIMAVHLLVGLR